MDDLKIGGVSSLPLEKSVPRKAAGHDPLGDFEKVLKDSVAEVNKLLHHADQSTQEMISGKQDVHQTMIAMEQANISLRLMVQVRNKLISAYEEIMRVQI